MQRSLILTKKQWTSGSSMIHAFLVEGQKIVKKVLTIPRATEKMSSKRTRNDGLCKKNHFSRVCF